MTGGDATSEVRGGAARGAAADSDAELVRRTARRLGLQATALVALAVLVLVGIGTVLLLHQQDQQARTVLAQATEEADDVNDPPAGVWLVLTGPSGTTQTDGLPEGLPDRAALNDVVRGGPARTITVHLDDAPYLVRTAPRDGGAVQAVLDLRVERRQRADLLTAMLITGLVGLALAAVIGTVLAHRAVRPLAEALSLQRNFVADASHELRTPLTLLSTRAQMLRRSLAREQADDRALSDADGVVGDVARLTDVVDDLLLAAEPAAVTDRGPVDLVALCHELVSSARDHATGAAVSLAVHAEDDQVVALGSGPALRRAVLAIVDNAISHTPRGGSVVLRLAVDGSDAVLDITDTGPGVPAEDADHVFDRFHSGGHKADRRSYGLGLALARDVVTRSGGRLTIESTSSAGTTFRLRLPRA
ncbi:sensor histidine kinase [Luteipulveratus flavus]|uniref:histidine kinase n=1 Tax=Luteipulveratus flavus TaxID=3031728 RepID=A0ABT6C4V4_9MICO|nr:HAMP domain-containing sensor histidine kinase [Luteipulveratus sp. YIM 133296]MDF8263578.1 HAMP domain-containing sensor histidine kinase [Luteipulveratus sp. YIM 133296]